MTASGAAAEGFHVRGTVRDGRGDPVTSGVAVQLADLRLGGEHLLGTSAVDERGTFGFDGDPAAARSAPGASLDLVVRVVRTGAPGNGAATGELLARSAPHFDAGSDTVLDVVVPSALVGPLDEYSRLVADLERQLPPADEPAAAGLTRSAAPRPRGLGELVEDGADRRDVTFLAGKTGWDARRVAMASLADRVAADTGIPAPLHYALYRAGLPAGDRLWALAPSTVLENVWRQAVADRTVPADLADELPAALDRAARLAERAIADLPTGVGDGRLGDLVAAAAPDAADQQLFLGLYREHRDDPASLWSGVHEQLGGETADRLQLVGALAALTRNNVPLMSKLESGVAPRRVGDLAAAGFHRAERWRAELTDEVPVPDGVPGDDDETRRAAYASLLAEELRLRHPTAVLAAEVADGTVPTAGPAGTADAVAEFLAAHADAFELALHPVDDYTRAHGVDLAPAVRDELTALQRIVSVAPAPAAVGDLRRLGFDSARSVALLGETEFVARAGAQLGEEAARATFRRSDQVHTAALATATSHLVARSAPVVYAVPTGGPAAIDGPGAQAMAALAATGAGNGHGVAAAEAGPVRVPTLETLFGPGDAAVTEHCESVLGPAAYLVDLLEFVDVDRVPAGTRNPQAVLLERRPDLQHIALSCANTEVELPYVDLVNEILEHVVVHASIAGYEGHDVPEGATSADLLATPSYVDDAAYTVLRAATYPLVLPWDQRLAALRAYLGKAGTNLRDAMAVLTPPDAHREGAPEDPARTWQDIVRERVGVGRAEREVLCGAAVTAQALYGDDPAQVDDERLVAGVGNARRLARRLGLTPEALVELVQTRFVNPDADLLGLLSALRVGFPQLQALHAGTLSPAQFLALLPPDLDATHYAGDVVGWLAARYERIMNLVLLTDPSGAEPPEGDSTGGFARLELRRALPDRDHNRLRPVDLLGIARFVRLRARLGGSTSRTDAVLTALWPAPVAAGAPAEEVRGALDAGFDVELVWLLGCVAPLGVDGPDAPYRRLFLTPGLLGADPAFGFGPDGRPPASRDALLLDHGPALQAALKLTAEELAVVADAAGFDPATPLSVLTVSALFRYGYLARALRIGVTELVALMDLTGWQPFEPPDEADPDLLRLIRMARLLRDSGLPVSRLVALVRGEGTPTEQADEEVLTLLHSVRTALAEREGPAGGQWTESALRSLLASVFAPDAVDAFLGLIADASAYTTPYTQAEPQLPEPVRAAAPALGYDIARAVLTHQGVLTAETAAAVAALPGLPPGLAEAVARLANAGQAEYQPLFRAQPLLEEAWQVWLATPADPGDPAGDARRAALGGRLSTRLTPALRQRRVEELLAPATGAEVATLAALLTDPVALQGSAPGHALGEDVAAVTASGLSARFWAGPPTGTPSRTAVVDGVRYGPDGVSLREAAGIAAGSISGSWAAAVEPPVTGDHTFSGATDGTAVSLRVGGIEVPVQHTGASWTAAPVRLVAGRPVELELRASGLDALLSLRWQADGTTVEVLPGAACCPADLVAAFAVALHRLRAALELAGSLELSVRELLSFARADRHRVGGVSWLSRLPGPPSGPAVAADVVAALADLARYRELRQRWRVTGTAIVDLLDAAVTDPPTTVVAALTGVATTVVEAAAVLLGVPGDGLRDLSALRRLADVIDLVARVPLPVPTLARAVTSTPSAADVRDVRDSLRGRYDEAAWQEVVRPVHDDLRRGARDALVGATLQLQDPDPDLVVDEVTGGYSSPDQLYERLLVDVQMDPCATTSRIAQAISTVQLFVARCLLNLESEVSPTAIDPQRWEAMKRYRVWEANRRVFLFPENWLDPELRDDKSPFFRDVETELLQSDITDQAAATALGHYLEKLDEVADLEIAGMHVDERFPSGVPDPIVHVIGRTFGAKRSYFHRTLDTTWRPWEPVNVEIQDDPVLPVIWKGRFLLFWLKVSKAPDARQPGPFAASTSPQSRVFDLSVGDLRLKATASLTVSLFWSEYYNGRWQSPRTSDPDRPIDLGAEFTVVGDPHTLRLASEVVGDQAGMLDSLGIIVLNPGEGGTGNSHFRLHTTHSLPVRKQDDLNGSLGIPSERQFSDTGPFIVTYQDDGFHPLTVLGTTRWPYRGIGPMHRLESPHQAPFFFQDSRHVFYVHPDPTDPVQPHPFGLFPGAATRLDSTFSRAAAALLPSTAPPAGTPLLLDPVAPPDPVLLRTPRDEES